MKGELIVVDEEVDGEAVTEDKSDDLPKEDVTLAVVLGMLEHERARIDSLEEYLEIMNMALILFGIVMLIDITRKR